MVWGCFVGCVAGPVIAVKGIINSDRYIDILANTAHPFLSELGEEYLLQEDNASVHKSGYSDWWKRTHSISTIDWPSQSPDLNPIENLWQIVDNAIRKRPVKPKNTTELQHAIYDEWKKLEPDLLLKLTDSMPSRIQAVIEANGYATKY